MEQRPILPRRLSHLAFVGGQDGTEALNFSSEFMEKKNEVTVVVYVFVLAGIKAQENDIVSLGCNHLLNCGACRLLIVPSCPPFPYLSNCANDKCVQSCD